MEAGQIETSPSHLLSELHLERLVVERGALCAMGKYESREFNARRVAHKADRDTTDSHTNLGKVKPENNGEVQ